MRLLPLVLCLSLAACAGNPSTQSSEPSQASTAVDSTEAVAALQKVDSAIAVGLSMMQYSNLLIEAKPTVDAYLQKDGTSDRAVALKRSMDGYLVALDWWRCDVEGASDVLQGFACRDGVLPSIEAMYPDIKAQVDVAVANFRAKNGREPSKRSIALDSKSVLQLIWKEVDTDLQAIAR